MAVTVSSITTSRSSVVDSQPLYVYMTLANSGRVDETIYSLESAIVQLASNTTIASTDQSTGHSIGQPPVNVIPAGGSLKLSWVERLKAVLTQDNTYQTLKATVGISPSAASATIVFGAGGAAAETITIGSGDNAVVFTAVASGTPVAASQQFQDATDAGTGALAAASFVLAVNAPQTQVLIQTLLGSTQYGILATRSTATVTLVVTGLKGSGGNTALATSASSHYTLSGASFTSHEFISVTSSSVSNVTVSPLVEES